MPESLMISVASLSPAHDNPRFEYPAASDQDAFRLIAQRQKQKIIALAKSIALTGWDEGAQLFVQRDELEPNRYVVREGNRRLTAIKCLEAPDMFEGALSPSAIRQINTIKGTAGASIPNAVRCMLYAGEEDTLLRDRLRNRHLGEQNGAGVVTWGAAESNRFDNQGRKDDQPAADVISFLRENNLLGREPIGYLSTLRRMLTTPELRNRLGLTVSDGELYVTHGLAGVATGLAYVVGKLASGDLKVGNVYYARQRIEYAKGIPEGIGLPPTMPPDGDDLLAERILLREAKVRIEIKPNSDGNTMPEDQFTNRPDTGYKSGEKGDGGQQGDPEARKRSVKPRDKTVVPRSFKPIPPTSRIGAILAEMRELEAERFGNACGVLLRVLLELSIDEYRVKFMGIKNAIKDSNLETKMVATAEDLAAKGELNEMQCKAIVAVARENSVKGVFTLHQLIHNQYYPYEPGPLFRMWDTLQTFLSAIYERCAEDAQKRGKK